MKIKKLLIIFAILLSCVFISAEVIIDNGEDASSITILTGNLTQFTQLTDTPASYSGEGNNCVIVGAGETALEFGACGTSASDGNASSICGDNEVLLGQDATTCVNLNDTIDDRASGLGDNVTWNQSEARRLFAPNTTFGIQELINSTDVYSTFNLTYNDYATNVSLNYTELTFTGYDARWNQSLWDNTFNDSFDQRALSNNTAGWTLNISELYPTNFFTLNSQLRWNMYDDGTDLILNVTDGGGNFEIMQDNSKITLFNNPVVANDFKVLEIFSKEASDVTEFVITKAGENRTSYSVRSFSISGNATSVPQPFNCTSYTNFIDCATDKTGADFYVQDDIEINGSLFVANGNFNVTDDGNVTGNFYRGDGSLLTNLPSAATDGNASSICASGEWLSGSGSCINFNTTLEVQGITLGFNQTGNDTYNDMIFNASVNWTENTFEGYDTRWNQSMWDDVFNASFDQRDQTAAGGGDGNASSICASGEWLSGSGSCINYNTSLSTEGIRIGFNQTGNDTYNDFILNVSINYTEKTVEGYDARWLDGNTSFNQTLTDGLYSNVTIWDTIFNASFDQREASFNETFNATYDGYATNVSLNYSEIVFDTWDVRWNQSLWDETFNASFDDRDTGANLWDVAFNASFVNEGLTLGFNVTFNTTYHEYATNVSLNYTELTFTGYDSRWNQSLWDETFNASFDQRSPTIWDTIFNSSFIDLGLTLGFNSTFNLTYDNYATNVSINWTEETITSLLTYTQSNVFTENQTIEGIFLEKDTSNHWIYDNATCIIMAGDTSTFNIC